MKGILSAISVFNFLFRGVFAHRVGKPPTYGGGGPRSGGEGGFQLYNAVFIMYVYHAPTVTPLARHHPREWEAREAPSDEGAVTKGD